MEMIYQPKDASVAAELTHRLGEVEGCLTNGFKDVIQQVIDGVFSDCVAQLRREGIEPDKETLDELLRNVEREVMSSEALQAAKRNLLAAGAKTAATITAQAILDDAKARTRGR